MTVHMSRSEWQAAQHRHTRVDGSPAIMHMVDGATVLEGVEFVVDPAEEARVRDAYLDTAFGQGRVY